MSHYPCLDKQYIQEVLSPYQVKLQKNWKDHLNSEILDKYIEIKRTQKQKLSQILPRYTIFPKCYDEYNIYTVNYDLDRLERIRNANNAKHTNLKLSKPKNSNIQQNDEMVFAKSTSQIISCPKRIQRQQDNKSDNKIKRKNNNLYERDAQSHIKFYQSKSTKSLTQTGVSPSKLSKKIDKKTFKNGIQSDSQLSIEHFRRQNYKTQTDNKSWTSNLRQNTNKQRENDTKRNFQNVQSALTVVRQKPKYQYESNDEYYYWNEGTKNRQIKNSKQLKRVNLVNDQTENNYSAFPQRRPYQSKMSKQGMNSKRTIRGTADQHQQRRKQNQFQEAAGKTIYYHRKQNHQLPYQNRHQYDKSRKMNRQLEQSQLSRLNNGKKTRNSRLDKQKNYNPSQSESRASCQYDDQSQSVPSKLQKRIQDKFNVKFKTSSGKRNNQVQKQKYPKKQQKFQAQLEKTNLKQRENHFTDEKQRRYEHKVNEKAKKKQIDKIRQNKDELPKAKSIETIYQSSQNDSLRQQTPEKIKLNQKQDQQFQNRKEQKSELQNHLEEEIKRDCRQKLKQQKDNNQNCQQSVYRVLSSQKQKEQRQQKKQNIITFSDGQNKQFSNLQLSKHQYNELIKGDNEENLEKRAKFRNKTQSQSIKQTKLEDQSENKNSNKLKVQGQRKQQKSMKDLKDNNSKKQLSQIEQETNQMRFSKDLDDNSAKMSAVQSKFSQYYGQEFERIKAERDYLRKHFILHLQNKHSQALPYKQLTSITIDSSGKKLILTSKPIPNPDSTSTNTFQVQMT